jgi:tRNA-specific 2-thiouridylase
MIIFPLGDYTKKEVRKIASNYDLGLDNKLESQNFIAGGYKPLFESSNPGPILNRYGEKIGEHHGIQFYTIGQRRGLGISSSEPFYVIDIDHENNTVTAGRREELYRDEFTASGMNWVAIAELKEEIIVKARIRYRHKEAEAIVSPLSGDEVHIKFMEPQRAITPGQTVVFYDKDTLIGSGTIEKTTG